MRLRAHLRLLTIGILAWAIFWVAGLPAYYRQYSRGFMIGFDLLLLPLLIFVFWKILKRVDRERRMPRALWMAFYFTVPLAFYDWFYCGLFLGCGLAFLGRYWYLTVYYVIPWLILPGLAFLCNKRQT